MKTSISFLVLVTLVVGKIIHHLGYVKDHCSHTKTIGTLALIKEHMVCMNKKKLYPSMNDVIVKEGSLSRV